MVRERSWPLALMILSVDIISMDSGSITSPALRIISRASWAEANGASNKIEIKIKDLIIG
jgi:hypothetical protein